MDIYLIYFWRGWCPKTLTAEVQPLSGHCDKISPRAHALGKFNPNQKTVGPRGPLGSGPQLQGDIPAQGLGPLQ